MFNLRSLITDKLFIIITSFGWLLGGKLPTYNFLSALTSAYALNYYNLCI